MSSVNSELFYTLFSSLSFYRTAVWWSVLSLMLLAIFIWLLWRVRPTINFKHFRSDQRGSSVAVDFVLTLPIFLTLLLLIVQFALMAHTALLVHYAAYSAARSARVWMWDQVDVRPWPRTLPALRSPAARINHHPEVQQRAETAARFALIAASPADPDIQNKPAGIPRSILTAMANISGLKGREQVLIAKAAYAFDPANSMVKIKAAVSSPAQPGLEIDASLPGDAWAVTATVVFKMSLDMPIAARLLGSARGDGSYYETSTAEVTLL